MKPAKMRGTPAVMVVVFAIVGCHGSTRGDSATGGGQVGQGASGGSGGSGGSPPESEAPVALNPNVPIAYPPALYDQKVEGDVTLRLFVDSTGKLIPESTRVAEPSGYPALDSAALAGASALKFAPAKRHGIPVATAFLQPVEFRQVGTTRTGASAALPPAATPPPTPPPAAAPVRPKPRPAAPKPTPPQPAPLDTTRTDTTKARTDTGPAL
jgi:TonB family protein